MQNLAEQDWKYISRLKPQLLDELCGRINKETVAIINDASLSQYERYLKMYKHVQDSDCIIGDCFNDWRRSRLLERILYQIHHSLLTPELIAGLTEETQERVKFWLEH